VLVILKNYNDARNNECKTEVTQINSLASLSLYVRGRSPWCQLNRRVGGTYIRFEALKEVNINGPAAIQHGFPVVKSLLIKLGILTQGPGFTSSFVTLTVILSEIVTVLIG